MMALPAGGPEVNGRSKPWPDSCSIPDIPKTACRPGRDLLQCTVLAHPASEGTAKMTTGITHEEQQRVPAAAWTAAYMWSDVVARCADRVLDSTDLTTVEHMGEAATLTVALRNVRRAAEVARPLATGQDRERIDAAIQAFEQGLPQAKDARDVLEHFDDYGAGTGWIQEKERKRGRTTTFYPPWYERGASNYYLRWFPARERHRRKGGRGRTRGGSGPRPTSFPHPAARCAALLPRPLPNPKIRGE
jgi:hypothetical protein